LEAFATRLFNDRGIGDPQRNDGVLLLLAVKDRVVRIELGSGYGRSLDARMGSVIETRMVPQFRRGDYGAGVVAGLEGVVGVLIPAEASTGTRQPIAPTRHTRSPQSSRAPTSTGFPIGWVAFFALLGLCGLAFAWRHYRRHRQRPCPHCAAPMRRLDEMSEDMVLSAGQQTEENLDSVDYDVWQCERCNEYLILPYRSLFSHYKLCQQCGHRTVDKNSVTVEEPTYDAEGLKKISEQCNHCDHYVEWLVTLPRRIRWSSDDDDFGGSSSSSFFSSSSSSGSSWGGGSSGGGRSSGGGASGRW
jgi:uncharacterized protein